MSSPWDSVALDECPSSLKRLEEVRKISKIQDFHESMSSFQIQIFTEYNWRAKQEIHPHIVPRLKSASGYTFTPV
jgi:hypothetical protein